MFARRLCQTVSLSATATRSALPQLHRPVTRAVFSTAASTAAQSRSKVVPLLTAGVATVSLGLYGYANSTHFAQAEAEDEPAKKEPTLLQKCIAEAIGTGIIVGGGCTIVAAAKYANSGIGLLGISTGFGMSVALAIVATGHISGAHLNPAVTISLIVNNGVDAALAVPYFISQFIGATVAGSLVYAGFSDGIAAAEKAANVVRGKAGSAAIFEGAFGLGPNQALVRSPGCLMVEIACTAALLFMINAITDPEGSVPAAAAPVFVGATVATLIGGTGPVNGCGMNPARDLGPRLVSALAGLRGAALAPAWWTYTIGPVIGAVIGGALYQATK